MTVTFMSDNKNLDVVVRPEQKIGDVYGKLLENGYFSPVRREDIVKVYSLRQTRYVNSMLTFRQGEIYEGDVILIEPKAVCRGYTVPENMQE